MLVTHIDEGRLKGILNCLMASFDGAIGRWMVGGCESNLYVEGLHHVFVQVCNKRIAVVRDPDSGGSEPRHEVHESFADLH